MKHKIFTLLFAIVASIGTMNAVKIGDLYYSLNSGAKTANVTKPDDGSHYDIVNLTIPSSVTYAYDGQESVTYTVEGIAMEAFVDCESLTSVSIPNTIVGIGQLAFARTGLTSVTIPNSVTYLGWWVFTECSNLKTVELGDNIAEMGVRCFAACPNLTSITIPSTLETIQMSTFDNCSNLSSVIIPEGVKCIDLYAFSSCTSLTEIIIPNSVTKIGEGAFQNCENLTSVTIGNGINSIGDKAFSGCDKIGVVNISNLDKWFYIDFISPSANPLSIGKHLYLNGSEVTDLVVPDDITTINRYSFINCLGIQSVKMGSKVTKIDYYAFSGCSNITSVLIGENVDTIALHAFEDCINLAEINIPDNVEKIEDYAFAGCTNLQSVTIGEGLTEVGYGIFAWCENISSVVWNAKAFIYYSSPSDGQFYYSRKKLTSFVFGNAVETIPWVLCAGLTKLTSISIPNSVKSIDDEAFYDCSGLTSLSIPNSVTSIGDDAFNGCYGLTSVSISNSVKSIGNDAFEGCSRLTSVAINDLSAWCNIDFEDLDSNPLHMSEHLYLNGSEITDLNIPEDIATIKKYAFYNCKGLNSVRIPSNVQTIDSYAFFGCTGLISAELGNGVKQIKGHAFYNCSNLVSITIPDGVQNLENNTFYDCTSLASLTIGKGVTNIGSHVFRGCTKITSITCKAVNPPSLNTDDFSSIKQSTPLYVPAESVDAYKTADIWKDFTNISAITDIEPTYFTVIFKNWNGATLKNEQVEEGHAATAPDVPEREGYTFTGWDKDFSNVIEDMIVTAVYEKEHEPGDPEILNISLNTATEIASSGSSATPSVADNVLKVNYSAGAWKWAGVEFKLDSITDVINVSFDYKGDGTNVVIYPYLRDAKGIRWTKGNYWLNLSSENWQSVSTYLPDALLWDHADYAFGDEPFIKFGFVANPGSETEGAFYLRNIQIEYKPAVPTEISDVQDTQVQSYKLLRDNQILILRGDKVYTITGQEVR